VRSFLIGFASLVGAITLAGVLVPLGEIATLVTEDEEGRRYETTLWVVDGLDGPYLRAGRPTARWLDRLILHPRVELEREGRVAHYLATPVDDGTLRRELNRKMAEKYGLIEQVMRRFGDLDHAVVVRLEPVEGPDGRRR